MNNLVKLVEKYPCLYDNTVEEYSDSHVTEKAWEEISSKMNWTIPDCKLKWSKAKMEFMENIKTQIGGSKYRRYYLFDSMRFLVPFIRVTYSDENQGDMHLRVQSLKRKLQAMQAAEENPRKMFLLSLVPDVKNLTDENMRSLKVEITSLVQKFHAIQSEKSNVASGPEQSEVNQPRTQVVSPLVVNEARSLSPVSPDDSDSDDSDDDDLPVLVL
ncbi:uncharacterized protein LOC142986634 [Anticarsia gemmatalis]|uniref:uncharacterized protein LOC142986634 n=1 Tax=Anticarsia gemmatalis TaxID=129554 RepID=UPI003F775882